MDEIRIPISLTVAIPLAPPAHPSRDGRIRNPSNGWRTSRARLGQIATNGPSKYARTAPSRRSPDPSSYPLP